MPHLAEEASLWLLIVEAVASGLRRGVVGALGCHKTLEARSGAL